MIQVDIQKVQADLPYYLEKVSQGEVVTVCKDGQPVAESNAVSPVPSNQPRPIGLGVGQGVIHPTFFDPLPPDFLAAFYGEEG